MASNLLYSECLTVNLTSSVTLQISFRTDQYPLFCDGASECSVRVCFSVIQLELSHTPEPRHVLSRHSLPITDLHCGLMGVQARVATASLDQTVKVRVSL